MPRQCQVCALSTEMRLNVEEQLRRDVPLRAIAEGLREAGCPVHRDTIWRHHRAHVVPPTDYGPAGPAPAAALAVAAAVAPVLERWPHLLAKAVGALDAEGLHAASAIFAAELPDQVRTALRAAKGTPGSELLEGRVLCAALRSVLPGYPEAGRDLARELNDRGAEDLADAIAALSVMAAPNDEREESEEQ